MTHPFLYILILFGTLSAPLHLFGTVQARVSDIMLFCEKVESDSFIVTRHGRPVVCQGNYRENIDTKEMSKVFVVLAALFMVEEKLIPCLDASVGHYLTHSSLNVKLRQLLRSTSDDDLAAAIYVMEKISGKCFEDYLKEKLFRPLQIQNASWLSAPLPRLLISSWELAKVGHFILNKCMIGNKRLLNEKLLEEMLQPDPNGSPFRGLQWQLQLYDVACWWDNSLLRSYCCSGVDSRLVERLAALEGRVIHCSGECFGSYSLEFNCQDLFEAFGTVRNATTFAESVYNKGLPFARCQTGSMKAYCALGEGGQQLLIMPQYGLVAIRQKRTPPLKCFQHENHEFALLVEALGYEYGFIE